MHQRNWALECSPWSPATPPILPLPHASDFQGLFETFRGLLRLAFQTTCKSGWPSQSNPISSKSSKSLKNVHNFYSITFVCSTLFPPIISIRYRWDSLGLIKIIPTLLTKLPWIIVWMSECMHHHSRLKVIIVISFQISSTHICALQAHWLNRNIYFVETIPASKNTSWLLEVVLP